MSTHSEQPSYEQDADVIARYEGFAAIMPDAAPLLSDGELLDHALRCALLAGQRSAECGGQRDRPEPWIEYALKRQALLARQVLLDRTRGAANDR